MSVNLALREKDVKKVKVTSVMISSKSSSHASGSPPPPQHPFVGVRQPPINRNHVIHLKKRNLKASFSLQTILPGIGEQFDNINEMGGRREK